MIRCLGEVEWGPPVPATRLLAFESKIGIDLPESYRDFLIQVGDGGPSPGFGRLLPIMYAGNKTAPADETKPSDQPALAFGQPREPQQGTREDDHQHRHHQAGRSHGL